MKKLLFILVTFSLIFSEAVFAATDIEVPVVIADPPAVKVKNLGKNEQALADGYKALLDAIQSGQSGDIEPVINSFDPIKGGNGTIVIFTGTYVVYVQDISFEDVSAEFVINSTTELSSTLPQLGGIKNSERAVPVKIISSSGAEVILPETFLFQADGGVVYKTPIITEFPIFGWSKDLKDFKGSNLLSVAEVQFDNLAAKVKTQNSTLIQVEVPNLGNSPLTNIPITIVPTDNNDPFIVTSTFEYSETPPASGYQTPVFTDFPTYGWEKEVKNFTGSNLIYVSEITFNGISGTINSSTDSLLEVKIPKVDKNPVSGVSVVATTYSDPPESVTITSTFEYSNTYIAPSFSQYPSSGWNGETRGLAGSGLLNVSSVTFNGTNATITSKTDTAIELTVPDLGTSTLNNVTIAAIPTIGNDITVTSSFTYEDVVYLAPTVSGHTPTQGKKDVTISLTGSNLLNVSSVTFSFNTTKRGVTTTTTATGTIASQTDTAIQVTVPNLGNKDLNNQVSLAAISTIGLTDVFTTTFSYKK